LSSNKSDGNDKKIVKNVDLLMDSLVEEQDKFLKNNCLNIKCFVKVFNFKIDSSDLEQKEDPSLKRKRDQNEYTRSEKENLNDSFDIEELELDDDTPVKKSRINNNTKNKPVIAVELSEYEKIREKNIKEREAMLKSLNLKEAFNEYKSESGLTAKRHPANKKSKIDISEKRRSGRLDSKTDTDPDYNPKEEDKDSNEPKDHEHLGLRKQPCKECPNCLQKDCRKCIFCRDKKQYGGPNLKKQKCEYKEKCSQPIIACYVCKGKTSFNCDECNKRFPYSHLLEEHNQDVHQVQAVRRRSSRLSTVPIISV